MVGVLRPPEVNSYISLWAAQLITIVGKSHADTMGRISGGAKEIGSSTRSPGVPSEHGVVVGTASLRNGATW